MNPLPGIIVRIAFLILIASAVTKIAKQAEEKNQQVNTPCKEEVKR